jgi:RsiW-degrading membrane proteinase PrsW (M82 family)
MIVVFASLVALIVTSNIYRNDAHPKLHSILVAFGTAFVGLFIISMVNVFIEMARRSGMPGY